jgi:hypothetical protein
MRAGCRSALFSPDLLVGAAKAVAKPGTDANPSKAIAPAERPTMITAASALLGLVAGLLVGSSLGLAVPPVARHLQSQLYMSSTQQDRHLKRMTAGLLAGMVFSTQGMAAWAAAAAPADNLVSLSDEKSTSYANM